MSSRFTGPPSSLVVAIFGFGFRVRSRIGLTTSCLARSLRRSHNVSTVNLIHDTRHLRTPLGIDGIKMMSRDFSGGKQVINKKSRSSLFILDLVGRK